MSSEVVRYDLSQLVWHKVHEEPGMITGIVFRDRIVNYLVTWEFRGETEHQAIELSHTRCYPGLPKASA